jgi:hypothetical protein
VLHVGRGRHDGPPRRFADGTELRTGDPLGVLHFDNARISALDGGTPRAVALQFRRVFFASLHELAALAAQDGTFGAIAVFRGIGWIRHGERIGFLHEPAPAGWRARWAILHVRLLVWAFTPRGGTAVDAPKALTVSWLTRRALMERFGGGRAA